ncbi:two pore channel protein 2-like isoform X2 [Crassostrea angulata]|uniref:two pore channel protein 2-like isoform X2 n=1 Tax=Magallana angulata TaxID=2784310 RepID=UPI0022B12C6F|nr:two pore channel protein 2-like isoform X2 [Crassostrea angulata]
MNDKDFDTVPDQTGGADDVYRSQPPGREGDAPRGMGHDSQGQLDFSFSTSVVRDFPEGLKNKHSINSPDNRNHVSNDHKEQSFCREVSERIHLLQATVFIEDAARYREICHRVDKRALQIYRMYQSNTIQRCRIVFIFVLHILAFFEYPSSLTLSSDIRFRGDGVSIPCGVTEGIELICLLFFVMDVIIKYWLIGFAQFRKKNWMIATVVVLTLSLIDWCVSIGFRCNEATRFRRIIRPFFIINYSNIMKKTVKCLQRTLPEVFSVLMLLGLHLFVFSLVGMLLFPNPKPYDTMSNVTDGMFVAQSNVSTPSPSNSSTVIGEGETYFRTLLDSFMNLLVLLTTANNPDVMMPVYQQNRFYSLYFIVFLLIGNYCFMNMLLAVIYNQFRGYFQTSMQSDLLRRRVGVRAAYEVLKETDRHGVSLYNVKTVIEHADLPVHVKSALREDLDRKVTMSDDYFSLMEFQACFEAMETDPPQKQKPELRWFQNVWVRRLQRCVAHRVFGYFGNLVATANVIVIATELSLEYDKSLGGNTSNLNIVNFVFVVYYFVEQVVKFVAFGWKRYVYEYWNIFDGVITVILVITEFFAVGYYGFPLSGSKQVHDTPVVWNFVRIINILILFRLLRIIPNIKAMTIVAATLVDLVRNLKAFAGILIVIYYSFAIVGIEIFHNAITNTPSNSTGLVFECGSYQQLEYWANNFDDFAAALVVLWDIMVVNNWSVFLKAYAKVKTEWSYLYFIIWWLFSVVIVMQLFTALIIENFIMKWDKSASRRNRGNSDFEESHHFMSVHDMFRESLHEPTEEEILLHISNNQYLQTTLS